MEANMTDENARPPIIISDRDLKQLFKLANGAASRSPQIADELLTELERAETCPASRVPYGVVRMQSRVRFQTDRGSEHQVELVYPEEADLIRDRLSVLSPIGTALIGLSEGQTMTWTDREGHSRWLRVLEVSHPADL